MRCVPQNKRRRRPRGNRAFTLIEILIVVTILGILAAMAPSTPWSTTAT